MVKSHYNNNALPRTHGSTTVSDWDSDDEEEGDNMINHIKQQMEYQNRGYITEERSYSFDIQTHMESQYPKLIIPERNIYAGNAAHSNSAKLENGTTVYFKEIINLYTKDEDEDDTILNPVFKNKRSKEITTKINTKTTNINMKPIRYDKDMTEAFQDIMEAVSAISRAESPTLVRCLNGGSRTVATFVAYFMLTELVTFRDAYLKVKYAMNDRAPINSLHEGILVTSIHNQMERIRMTTINGSHFMEMINNANHYRWCGGMMIPPQEISMRD